MAGELELTDTEIDALVAAGEFITCKQLNVMLLRFNHSAEQLS